MRASVRTLMAILAAMTLLAALRLEPAVAATPAVFMTAKVQPNEVERYRALGAIDVIAKPFDPMG